MEKPYTRKVYIERIIEQVTIRYKLVPLLPDASFHVRVLPAYIICTGR